MQDLENIELQKDQLVLTNYIINRQTTEKVILIQLAEINKVMYSKDINFYLKILKSLFVFDIEILYIIQFLDGLQCKKFIKRIVCCLVLSYETYYYKLLIFKNLKND